MKFDSSALPLLPTQQELTELNDLLLSAMELYQTYATLERHPRVTGSVKSVELFTSCREQLHQDISLLDKQLEILLTLSRATVDEDPQKAGDEHAVVHAGGGDGPHPLLLIPDVEPTDMKQSVFEIMRKAFHTEDLFSDQLNASLRSAQTRKHLKLELQLKMIILSADQRCRLLEDRYGYARTKNLLFQGLRRQTTRFLSALNGEKRTDIDR
ncbi:MAG TPA: hypothetical protein VGZ93_00080 [Candidatus Methylacidiphilales bacterium]|jgi:hypothetical protein|nr:hypothetical protein [Candidatus Methylacidiphilales bacterium]